MPHFGARQSLLCYVSRAVCPVGPDGEILVSWHQRLSIAPFGCQSCTSTFGDGQVRKMQSLTTPWEAGKTRLNTMHFLQWQMYLCPTSTWFVSILMMCCPRRLLQLIKWIRISVFTRCAVHDAAWHVQAFTSYRPHPYGACKRSCHQIPLSGLGWSIPTEPKGLPIAATATAFLH